MPNTIVPNPSQTVRLYGELYLTRRVEEEVARVYPTDKIQRPVHLSIGQEAVAVGVCSDPPVDAAVLRGHHLFFWGEIRHRQYLTPLCHAFAGLAFARLSGWRPSPHRRWIAPRAPAAPVSSGGALRQDP